MDTGLIDISTGYGNVNFSNVCLRITAQRLTAPFVRDSLVLSGVRTPGSGSSQSAGTRREINGVLFSDRVQLAPGTLAMLSVTKTMRGATIAQGTVLLRLRPRAAVISVCAKIPASRENFFGPSFNLFHGPADIMSVEEIELLGVRIPNRFREMFFNMDEINELIEITEITGEVAARPEISAVSTPEGVVIREVPAEPRRRITLRK